MCKLSTPEWLDVNGETDGPDANGGEATKGTRASDVGVMCKGAARDANGETGGPDANGGEAAKGTRASDVGVMCKGAARDANGETDGLDANGGKATKGTRASDVGVMCKGAARDTNGEMGGPMAVGSDTANVTRTFNDMNGSPVSLGSRGTRVSGAVSCGQGGAPSDGPAKMPRSGNPEMWRAVATGGGRSRKMRAARVPGWWMAESCGVPPSVKGTLLGAGNGKHAGLGWVYRGHLRRE
jgi:hypothetical protein